jgi:hypothetical protein
MADTLRLGRVTAVHPEDNSVDLVMLADWSRIVGAQVISGAASTNTGLVDLVVPTPVSGDKWDFREVTDRDVIAIVGMFGVMPVVLGFLFPQVNEMLFAEPNRRIMRHASDVYTSIDGDGNFELAHPSGAFVRLATTPDHEDLTGKDFDGRWKITKNLARELYLTVQVGTTTIKVNPGGDIAIHHDGNLTLTTGGDVTATVTGDITATAATASLTTTGDTTLNAGGAVNVTATTGVTISSITADVTSSGAVTVAAASASVTTTGAASVSAGSTLNLSATTVMTLTAPTIDINASTGVYIVSPPLQVQIDGAQIRTW